jgi:hypothetical protein
MNGDAKNHSTMRRTTVNHVVMLSAPFLFIFGIFSLASMRERNMDLHHSRHQPRVSLPPRTAIMLMLGIIGMELRLRR